MDCKHNKIIRIITPTPRHQCLSCGAEFVPSTEAETAVGWALMLGLTCGVAVMLVVALLLDSVAK